MRRFSVSFSLFYFIFLFVCFSSHYNLFNLSSAVPILHLFNNLEMLLYERLSHMIDLETSRYDRQIRLWGKDAQLRLMETSVRLRSALGVSGEVAKNLVLAGVKSVCVTDDSIPDPIAWRTNYLLQGQNPLSTAEVAVVSSLKRLNPFVHVTSQPPGKDSDSATVSIEACSSLSILRKCLNVNCGVHLVVSLVQLGPSCVVFFFYQGEISLGDQLAQLMDPSVMHLKPPLVQKAILYLHLRDDPMSDSSFVHQVINAQQCAAELHTYSLTDSDINDCVSEAVSSSSSCAGFTVCGAAVAQHIVQAVTTSASVQTCRWLVYDDSRHCVYLDVPPPWTKKQGGFETGPIALRAAFAASPRTPGLYVENFSLEESGVFLSATVDASFIQTGVMAWPGPYLSLRGFVRSAEGRSQLQLRPRARGCRGGRRGD
eukprot:gene8649-6076_t